MKVNFKELKNAVKQLNEVKETKIKFIGVTSERLLQDFMDTCGDFGIEELPELAKNLYSTIESQSIEEDESTSPPKEKIKTPETSEVKKEYTKSDYINAAKELMESLSIENEDGSPAINIEGKVKIKYLKEKLFEVYTSCTDSGISLEDECITKETQNLLDFIFKEKTENETIEEKQSRHVNEVLKEEDNKKEVKSKETKKKKEKIKDKSKKEKKQREQKTEKVTKTQFVANLIEEGKYTIDEIIEISTNKMGIPKSSTITMINHGKTEKRNHKYKPFKGRLITIKNEKVCFDE